MQSASSKAINYGPTHLGAKGTSVFGVGARVPTRVFGPRYQLRTGLTHLVVGSMWGLLPHHTGLVSHYGQARGGGDKGDRGGVEFS